MNIPTSILRRVPAAGAWLVIITTSFALANIASFGSRDAPQSAPEKAPARLSPTRAFVPGVISGRVTDAANSFSNVQTVHPDRVSEYSAIADNSIDLRKRVADGDDTWTDFVLDMDTSEPVFGAIDMCSKTYLHAPCAYGLDVVVAPVDEHEGAIVFVRSEVRGAAQPKDCRDYAACLAHEYMGARVPIPADHEGLITHRKE